MSASGIGEDLCTCGHVASAHLDGDGECGACKAERRIAFAIVVRCHRFNWAARWETSKPA